MRYQRSIAKEICFSGIGLHLGNEANVRILPAPPDTGIIFIVKNLKKEGGKNSLSINENNRHIINANVNNVVETNLCTTLGLGGLKIYTVEHLLAAFSGLCIDNLFIEIDSNEIPIMDGSALPFIQLVNDSGVIVQEKIKPYIKITKKVTVEENGKCLSVVPSEKPLIIYSIDYMDKVIGKQNLTYYPTEIGFIEEISKARTFGFLKDVEYLKANGMIKGGSLSNAIVIGSDGILNYEGLRYKDEFVRHKVLDLIGDISLLGFPILGEITGYCSGHSLNVKLASKILEESDSWVLEDDSSNSLLDLERGLSRIEEERPFESSCI